MAKYVDYNGVKHLWQKMLAKFAPLTRALPSGGTSGQVLTKDSSTDYDISWVTPISLDWTLVDTFTTTAKTITIGDCHEVLIIGSLWNDAMKVSSVFVPSELAASTWYKIGGAYRNSSTNLDAEMECSAKSGSGSTTSVTLKISAAYVNGGDRSSTSTFKVYTR